MTPRPGTQAALTGAAPLPRLDRLLLAAEIVSAYARIRWWLSRRTVPATVARARRAARRPAVGAAADAGATASRLARAVGRTLEPLPTDSRCLMRSLVLTALLGARGIDSTLVIGTRAAPDFAAHAWVEVDGRPVLPDGDGGYGRVVEI